PGGLLAGGGRAPGPRRRAAGRRGQPARGRGGGRRSLIRVSIRRPVAVAMTYGAVALLGAFAWRNIPIELLPDHDLPRLTVRADWRGASPETVEAFLTAPLESAIQQIRGVERIVSDSREGLAEIQVEFQRDTDMNFARL